MNNELLDTYEENKYAKYGQPTLDLVFTGPKESVTDRAGNVGLEFTRSSTATYVGSDGLIKSAAVNEARFDHDKDGNGLGLLIERVGLTLLPTPLWRVVTGRTIQLVKADGTIISSNNAAS